MILGLRNIILYIIASPGYKELVCTSKKEVYISHMCGLGIPPGPTFQLSYSGNILHETYCASIVKIGTEEPKNFYLKEIVATG
jgi:hypothetical protein